MIHIAKPSLKKLGSIIQKNQNLNVYQGYVFELDFNHEQGAYCDDLRAFVEQSLAFRKTPYIEVKHVDEVEKLFLLFSILENQDHIAVIAETKVQAKYLRTLFDGIILIPYDNGLDEADLMDLKEFAISFYVPFKSYDKSEIVFVRKQGFKVAVYEIPLKEIDALKHVVKVDYTIVKLP